MGARTGRAWLQGVLVLAVLLGSVGVARFMFGLREDPVAEPRPVIAPLVELAEVRLGPETLEVATLGELRPRREGALTPEISGRVTSLAPEFVQGGAVAEGQILVELDAEPLRVNVLAAEAQVAQAEARVARLEAEAERSIDEWRRAGREGDVPPLVARVPDLAEARAVVASAEASLAEARLDLDRATVRAPFTGRVRAVRVADGAYVQRGQELGELYQTDPMEVRMYLTERELARLDVDRLFGAAAAGPEVRLTVRALGRSAERLARVTRVGGEVDPGTRMVELVAEVAPRADGDAASALPLLAGDFVGASVAGRTISMAARLPRIALYEPGLCLVVNQEGSLERRRVNVAMQTDGHVVVDQGLAEGERVVVSPLDVAVDGMTVRVAEPEDEGDVGLTGAASSADQESEESGGEER